MKTADRTRTFEILLVEDNPGDVRLTEETLKESALTHRLSTARDGVEAISFLRQEGIHRDAPRPDLILLDLNLPRKDGREVLAEIKSDRRLKLIPVVVLTTSDAEQDVLRSYDLHANCYITKPVDLDEFIDTVKAVETFWLGTVRLLRSGPGAS